MINEDENRTTPFKLAAGTKPSVSHLRVLLFPYVVRKDTANIETKAINMRHQVQNCFCCIFVGIPQHQKGYLVYVPHTRKIVSSYDVVFDEIFSSALVYMSQPYAEDMAVQTAMLYIRYATTSKEQTDYIITFPLFEEVNLLS